MYLAQPMNDFGYNPLSKLKKGARAVGRGIKKGAKKVGSVAEVVASKAWRTAAYPVRLRINAFVNRRARKISWDRRKSKQPTRAEHDEARAWVKNVFRSKGAKGKLLATLTGAPTTALFGDFGISPVWLLTPGAPIALIVIVAESMQSHSKEAPADPETPDGQPAADEQPTDEQPAYEQPAEDEQPSEPSSDEEAPADEGETSGAFGASASRTGLWVGLGLGLAFVAAGLGGCRILGGCRLR